MANPFLAFNRPSATPFSGYMGAAQRTQNVPMIQPPQTQRLPPMSQPQFSAPPQFGAPRYAPLRRPSSVTQPTALIPSSIDPNINNTFRPLPAYNRPAPQLATPNVGSAGAAQVNTMANLYPISFQPTNEPIRTVR